MGDNGIPPAPRWRKCTAYRRLGAGGMPLALHLSEGLGGARWTKPRGAWCAEGSEQDARDEAQRAYQPGTGGGAPVSTTTVDGAPGKDCH